MKLKNLSLVIALTIAAFGLVRVGDSFTSSRASLAENLAGDALVGTATVLGFFAIKRALSG